MHSCNIQFTDTFTSTLLTDDRGVRRSGSITLISCTCTDPLVYVVFSSPFLVCKTLFMPISYSYETLMNNKIEFHLNYISIN